MLTTNQDALAREEFSLAELVRILRAHAGWVVGIPAILAAVTLAIQLMTPRQWEAGLAVRMGQVGQVGATGPSSEYIEPIPRSVERMKQDAFQDAVLTELAIPTDEKNPRAALYKKSLRIRQIEYTDTIEVRVRGFSPDEAMRSAEATVKHLRDVHAHLTEPTLQRLKRQLAEVRGEMDRIQAEREVLVRKAEEKSRAGVGFAEKLLFDNMIYQMGVQRRDLEVRALAYEENLGPLRTWETAALDKTFVGKKPVARQTPLRVVLAGLVGLSLGGFVALIINALKRSAERVAE